MSDFQIFIMNGAVRYFLGRVSNPVYFTVSAVCVVLCIVLPYLMGQLNFAIILSEKKFGADVRDYGSGNGGTTNMLRTFGKKYAVMTLVGDMGKGVAACLLGYLLYGRLGAFIAGLFCVLGHTMPIKYKFRGGKGVATAAAVILMTDLGNPIYVPVIFLALILIFASIALGLKYVSLASVMCMLLYPLILFEVERLIEPVLADQSGYLNEEWGLYVIFAFIMALVIILKHYQNIKRLMHGKEPKLDLSKRSKPIFEQEKEAAQDSAEAGDNRTSAEKKQDGKPNRNTSRKKGKRRR